MHTGGLIKKPKAFVKHTVSIVLLFGMKQKSLKLPVSPGVTGSSTRLDLRQFPLPLFTFVCCIRLYSESHIVCKRINREKEQDVDTLTKMLHVLHLLGI